MTNTTGVIIVETDDASAQFDCTLNMVAQRVAQRVWGAEHIVAAHISTSHDDLQNRILELVGRGLRDIVLVPAPLHLSIPVQRDIEAVLSHCRKLHPAAALSLHLPPDAALAVEDSLVERVWGVFTENRDQPVTGPDIECRSHAIIDSRLSRSPWAGNPALTVVRRVIHATADVSFADSMRVHPDAVARGVRALREGKPVICDVEMVRQGITRYSGSKLCAIRDAAVRDLAQAQGTTRSAAAMEWLRDSLDGAVVAVGNAPTALWKLMAMTQLEGGPQPALVIGLPVGFVGALESKLALSRSELVSITNTSPRGGSPAAAAAVNALSLLADEEEAGGLARD